MERLSAVMLEPSEDVPVEQPANNTKMTNRLRTCPFTVIMRSPELDLSRVSLLKPQRKEMTSDARRLTLHASKGRVLG